MTSEDTHHEFEALLEYLKRTRGFDFSCYKHPSLMRRIAKRMQQVNLERYSDYVDYLEVHPEEFGELFNTILINVTGFFRDPSLWDYLRHEIVPRLVAGKRPEEPIRVWSAGCASGEEAYSLAMTLSESLGPEAFRQRVKIYSTDVDEEALNHARQASYSAKQVEGVPPELLEKYFERVGDRYLFSKDLRRSVIFGRLDLIHDAPISRLDLLVCRNTLMYFNAEAQTRILDRFHFALNEGGYVCLGRAEMLLAHASTFTAVDLKQRVFAKTPRDNSREQVVAMNRTAGTPATPNPLVDHARLREAAADMAPVPQLVIDPKGALALANAAARARFGLTSRDLGRPFQDLDISYRAVELRPSIDQAYAQRRPVVLREVRWQNSPGEVVCLEIQVTPLSDNGGSPLGVGITFDDVTTHKRLLDDLQQTQAELESANEELQSANEELETTNEELQSTNEELETTNEELQSTNEELETMNEELQSANEELQTINQELRQRSDELNQVNGFLESILSSMRNGAAVMDRDLLVRLWNHRAEDLWGLRAEEVRGKHFLNLDFGLPLAQVQQSMRACLDGDGSPKELLVDAVNRRGKAIRCRIQCSPLVIPGGERHGVIVFMEESQDGKGAHSLDS